MIIYHRPKGRNNKALEGGHNGTINLGMSDKAHSSEGTFLRWINTSKKDEVGFLNRIYQLTYLKSYPKTKSKRAIAKDKAIETTP